jgi:hypothetical protein
MHKMTPLRVEPSPSIELTATAGYACRHLPLVSKLSRLLN